MQDTNARSSQDELIRLLLKRQSELNSLLEVTRAINKNTATSVLIQMLEVILQNYLHVGSFRFLIEKNNTYACISKYGGEIESSAVLSKACASMDNIKSPEALAQNSNAVLAK